MERKDTTVADVQKYRATFQKFIQEVTRGQLVPPVPMVNNGYLHTLNASFDGLFLREQQSDSLLVANHSMNFGTIQPCIRTEDKQAEKRSLLHLGLFNICGFSILGVEQMSAEQMADKTIREFLTFYTDYLHLDPSLLCIYIFGGGRLNQITEGVIKSDEHIKPDDFSVKLWQSFGIGKDQFIPEFSKETFLLHLGNPLREHHAGYRNDIFMHVGESAYEVATLNFISHQTVIKGEDIVGIRPLPFYLREMAVGQERILAAVSGSHNVYELPYVKPIVETAKRFMNDQQALIYADTLRAVHYFFSDGWTYHRLTGEKYKEHRHELNKFMKILTSLGSNIDRQSLNNLLLLNVNLQPWYPQLKEGVAVTIKELENFLKRKTKS